MATVGEDRIKGRRNGNGNVWRAHNALGPLGRRRIAAWRAKKEGEIGVGNWDAPTAENHGKNEGEGDDGMNEQFIGSAATDDRDICGMIPAALNH